MISRTEIKYMAGSGAYTRGLNLYMENHVQEFDVDREPEIDDIFALVRGSGRKFYDVNIEINRKNNNIRYANCECPAFMEYDGICKHCVAVLLEYCDYLRAHDRQKTFAPVKKTVHTSPEISALLQKQAVVKSLPLLQEEIYGKVRLEPSFSFDGRNCQVEFKIGVSRTYVLKDVFGFINALDKKENVKYGKNLEFVHTEDSFEEESRPFVQFIRRWVENNRELHSYGRSYYYSYYIPSLEKVRYMDLRGNELGEFLLLFEGRKIHAVITGDRNDEWQVVREHPPRTLTITGKEDGIEIKASRFSALGLSDQYRVYMHEDKFYVEETKDLQPIMGFLEAATLLREGTGYIENKDVPAFCKDILPEVQKFFTCRMVGFDPENYGMELPKFQVYLDAPQKNMITCNPLVSYGKEQFSIFTTDNISMRDLAAEQLVKKVVQEYTNAFDPNTLSAVIVDDEEQIYDFLVYGIAALQALGEVYISDALKRMEVRNAPRVSVGVSLESGLLELSLTAGDMSKDELIDILSRYNRKKKYYRLKDGSFVNAQNSGLDTLAELKSGLQLTDRQLKQEKVEVQKYRALYLDTRLKEDPTVNAIKSKSFKSLVRNMKTVEDNDFEVPESLANVLRTYQKYGFLWIKTLHYNGFGGILADDMGLGKTLQVIAFLLSEYLERKENKKEPVHNQRNALIVSPASLVYNWDSEIRRFAPELSPKMVTGNAAERQKILREAGSDDILLTSYDLLKRDIQEYENYKFRCQIIDEAQYIKNAGTQAAKAVKEVQAEFKLALTGTPVENRLSELWSIFDYLMPGFLYGYKKFKGEIETPIVQNDDDDVRSRLQKMIRPFVLRRLKKDVLSDLPDKLEESVFAKLNGEQQKLYDAHVKRMILMLDKQSEEEFKSAKITILAELTRLRQICCDPSLVYEDYQGESSKADMCMNMISNAVEGGHKVLLFSQFTTMLDHLAKRMDEEHIKYHMLTGSVNKEKRAQMVTSFQTDDTPVFCISLKAGGTGLNLTAADIVIHFDPWWNLAVQNQATDRAHRIGQKNVVNVYKLIVKDTIEENIMKLQEKKRELADQILEGDSLNGSSLTKEELIELLQ